MNQMIRKVKIYRGKKSILGSDLEMLVQLFWEAAHVIGQHLTSSDKLHLSQLMKIRLNYSWVDLSVKTKYLIAIKVSAQIAGD